MLHVGVDLHKRAAQVAVVDGKGKVLSNCRLDCDEQTMVRFFDRLSEPAQVVMEATSNWYWLADLLQQMEIPVCLAHPFKTKAIACARIKTDKIDAETLAQLLRADLVPAAHISSADCRLNRELLRHRAVFVRMRTAMKNRVHAFLAKYNLKPEGKGCGLFTRKGREWLKGLGMHPVRRAMLERMLTVIQVFDTMVKQAKAEIQVRAEADEQARHLDTIPGISYYSALLIVAEIDGVDRFENARRLCSWAGLAPSVRASGDRTHLGHITKQGSSWLRWILVEVSQKAGSRRDFLGRCYRRIERRKGKGAAKVATARKLLKAIYLMLKYKYSFDEVERLMKAKGASSCARMATQRPSH